MTELTPAMENAFRLLGVTPDADHSTIRSAWKAMVRAYHPDQVTKDKVEANRRLAEMNSAFDLVSAWSPEDARAYVAARAKCRAAQTRARQAEAERKAAAERAAELREREAGARADAEKAGRRRAAELDRRETTKRSAGASKAQQYHPKVAIAREKFLASMRELAPRNPPQDFGFV